MKEKKYFPTLIIGAGGTGIKVLRFIQSIADSGLDEDLKHMLDSDAISMVGIDTDKKSNEEIVPIDPNLARSQSKDDQDSERMPPRLLRLRKNWIHVDRGALNHAIARVHDNSGQMEDDSDAPLRTIRKWFPLKNEKTGDQITLGHSKLAGAAQWRPLGRLALFLNAQRIYDTLQKAYKEVQQSDPEQPAVRAYIISSLAGGTGSGMFWDLAFFLQMIDPGTQTSGMFLLGDPFEGVDEGGRIFPNIYAAVKEMATFKNWREPLEVEYPIGRGRTFKGQPLGPLAFDMVYLYQAFTPGPDVVDRGRATIDITCYRMAQNLITLSRRDLYADLDVGANNMESDTTAMPSSSESSFCFSTTGTTLFTLQDSDLLAQWVQSTVIKALRPPSIDTSHRWDLSTLLSELGLLPETQPDDLLSEFKTNLLQKVCASHPTVVQQLTQQMQLAQEYMNKEENFSVDHVLEQFLPDHVWLAAQYAAENRAQHFSLGSLQEIYGPALKDGFAAYLKQLKSHVNNFVSQRKELNPAAQAWVEEAIAFLDRRQSELPFSDPVELELPDSFLLLRDQKVDPSQLSFGQRIANIVLDRQVGQSQNQADQRRTCKIFIENLLAQLEALGAPRSEMVEPLYLQMFNQNRSGVRELLESLVNASKAVHQEVASKEQEDKKVQAIFEKEDYFKGEYDQRLINEILRACLPPGRALVDRDIWLKNQAKVLIQKLNNLLAQLYPGKKLRQFDVEPVAKYLGTFTDNLEAQFEKSPGGLEPYPLVQLVLDILEHPKCENAAAAGELIRRARKIAEAVVRYWNAQGNLLLQQAGGEEGLRRRILKCRSKLFTSGIIENKINKKHLVVMPYSDKTGDQDEDQKKSIKETFDRMAQEVMHTKSLVTNRPTDRPVIFYNDLFRSAEEIARIRDYYNAYNSYSDQASVTFFHVDRRMAALAHEVVGDALEVQPVSCGNADCTYNIRHQKRSELACRSCKRPIWNRCGNRDCPEDNLLTRLKDRAERRNSSYPFECPSCKQELKTYWWRCNDPCHDKKVPADKETCPQCLLEYQKGERPHGNITRRPDLRDIECPACLDMQVDPRDRGKVPPSLVPYYHKGVNGHDSINFHELVTSYSDHPSYETGKHLCRYTGQEHYLFPTCPKGAEDIATRHHLYLNGDRFVCTKHPRMTFYQCSHCDYPVSLEQSKCGKCPRCLRKLANCDYCSDKNRRLYTPIQQQDTNRCPNCLNLMERDLDIDPQSIETGLKTPGFCSNLYGCKAGQSIYHTAGDYHLGKCRVCPEDASLLYPRDDMEQIIGDCPLCLAVLGEVLEDNRKIAITGEIIAERFFTKNPDELAEKCLICGSRPSVVLTWMEVGGFGKPAQEDKAKSSDKESQEAPKVIALRREIKEAGDGHFPDTDFDKAREILQVLNQHNDDAQAFQSLKKTTSIQELLKWDKKQMEDILSIFPKGSRVAKVIRKRLQGLWKHQKDLRDRTAQWLDPKEDS